MRNIIPDEIIDREKQGFSAPITEWSQDTLGDIGGPILERFCKETDILDWNSIKDFIQNRTEGSSKRDKEWWPLLNLALWWLVYIKQEDVNEVL